MRRLDSKPAKNQISETMTCLKFQIKLNCKHYIDRYVLFVSKMVLIAQ